MEFYLSKILNFFINPIHILFLVVLIKIFLILFVKLNKFIIFFSKLFLFLFLFFSYTPLSNFIMYKIEEIIQPSRFPIQQMTGVVVLGGNLNPNLISKERNESNLGATTPRLLKALEIYKNNPRIIILYSSFSEVTDSSSWNDYEVVKKFFLDQGVKSGNLIFENKSRNTSENINNSKDIIKNYKGVWGLITSASHMPRSFYAFKKQGIILEPINVDYKTGTSKVFWINFDILSGVNYWFIIFHEALGLAYYKLTNKI
jgi:uncharacterized SAM-binding protein YcdF (DUF218 family)